MPAVFFVIEAIQRSPSYEVGVFPALWVPVLLVATLLLTVGLSAVYHRRLHRAGVIGTGQLYQQLHPRLGWLARSPLFVGVPIVGVAILLLAPSTGGATHDELVAAGFAAVGTAAVAALSWMLGTWVRYLGVVGQGLGQQAMAAQPSRVRLLMVLQWAPAGLIVASIGMSLTVLDHSIAVLAVAAAAWLICLVGTCALGLAAGYRPPGEPATSHRYQWYALTAVGVAAGLVRLYALWHRR